MRNRYYDMPPQPYTDPWQTGGGPEPVYEETVPGDGERKGKKGKRIALFCVGVALIAAGLITLTVFSGFQLTLDLPSFTQPFEKPGGEEDFGFDFDFDFGSELLGSAETTIPRAQVGEEVEVELLGVPETVALTFQEIYEKVLPSIVGIRAYGPDGGATGTGVVLSEEGYIITNFHVIEGAESAEVVLLQGERVLDALLVGGDAANDLAVLKVEGKGFYPAEFGDSSLLRVGDVALAIGNPLGEELAGTMTDGIISAINRDVNVDGITMTLLQTTAALNSGNSGGALINQYGQVVGITNMKMSSQYTEATIEGLGFAIPTVTVKDVVEELIERGYIGGRPTLGITVQTLPETDWSSYDLPEDFTGGILVVEVQRNSDAWESGVRAGDIIVSGNGEPIAENDDLLYIRDGLGVGDVITLGVWRSGEYLEFDVELIEQYVLDNIR